jgi:hypothetical protein
VLSHDVVGAVSDSQWLAIASYADVQLPQLAHANVVPSVAS